MNDSKFSVINESVQLYIYYYLIFTHFSALIIIASSFWVCILYVLCSRKPTKSPNVKHFSPIFNMYKNGLKMTQFSIFLEKISIKIIDEIYRVSDIWIYFVTCQKKCKNFEDHCLTINHGQSHFYARWPTFPHSEKVYGIGLCN